MILCPATNYSIVLDRSGGRSISAHCSLATRAWVSSVGRFKSMQPTAGPPAPAPAPAMALHDEGAGARRHSTKIISSTLLRSSDSRFNLIFKHDSESNLVGIAAVGESDVTDDRSLIHAGDVVVRVNGVRTVCALPAVCLDYSTHCSSNRCCLPITPTGRPHTA